MAVTTEIVTRAGMLAIGHGAKRTEEFFFDWILYGAVAAFCVHAWGPVQGGLVTLLIMAPLSALVSLYWIAFYNWSGKDWLGLEALREFTDSSGGWWITRIARRIVRSGKSVPAFLVLSFWTDPFMTTVFFREQGQAYTKLTPRDTDIFWCSVIVSNAYWSLRWTLIVEAALWIWERWRTILEPLLERFSS